MKPLIPILLFLILSIASCSQTDLKKRLELRRLELENKYRWVGQFDSATLVATFYDNGEMGYIDTNGKQILPIGAYHTLDFSDGMGIYSDIKADVTKAIDKNGRVIKEFRTVESLQGFKKGLAIASDTSGKYGVINFNEKWIIPCRYSYLEQIAEQYYRVSDFGNGMGIINIKGDTIIPLEYIIDYIDTVTFQFIGYHKRIGHAIFDSSGNVKKYLGKDLHVNESSIDGKPYFQRNGVIILEDRFESLEAKYALVNLNFDTIVPMGRFAHLSSTNEGLIVFSDSLRVERIDKRTTAYQRVKSGFLNTKGEVVIPASFDVVQYFSEGLCAVQKGYFWGYIDTTGKLVIPLEYTYALPFKNGYAKVERNSKFFIIDKKGKVVLNSKPY